MGNDNELSILIKAKNEASRVLNDVKQDVSGLSGKLGSAMDEARGASFGLLGAVTAVGVGVAGFGVASVKAFMEAQDASAQLDAVLQSTAGAAGVTKDQLLEQATALQSVTKFSDEAVQATQAMLLTFTNIKGGVMQEATQTTLDMAQALGMDGKQAAMQLGKALNDPIDGLTKLTRVGVTFSKAQEDQVKQMVAAGDVAGAQRVILGELNKEFGGSAVAAGKTFAGQLEILKNTFGDLMETVGSVILTALQPLMSWFQRVVKSMQDAGGVIPYLTNIFREHQAVIYIVAGAIAVALVPALVAMAAGAWAAVAPLLPFLAIGAAVGALVFLLAQHFGGFGNLLNVVKDAFMGVWNVLVAALWPSLQALWNTIANNLIPTLVGLWNFIAPILLPILKVVAIVIGATLVAGIWIAINALNIIINVISTTIGVLVAIYSWFWKVTEPVRSVFGGIVGIIRGALGGVWDAITGPFRAAFDWVKGAVGDVVKRLKDLNPFQRHSPSLVDLVRSGTAAVKDAYGGMFNDISSMAKNATAVTVGQGVAAAPQQIANNQRSTTNAFYGQIQITSPEAADQFFNRLDRSGELASMGVPI